MRIVLLAVLFLACQAAAHAQATIAVHLAEGVDGAEPSTQLGALLETLAVPGPPAAALVHWLRLRDGEVAAAALESVQFAAWRIREQGYRLLALSERQMGYSLLVRPGTTLLDVDALAGLRVAVPAPPSLPALQLLALFPDPLRAPRLHAIDDFVDGVSMLRAGLVEAAVVPEAMATSLPDLAEVLTLEETPVAVLTIAPQATPALEAALRERVVGEPSADGGLRVAGGRLLAAGDDDLERRARLLQGTWRAGR